MLEYFEIAKITKTHALKGEVKAVSYASDISDFKTGNFFLEEKEDVKKPIEITRVAPYKSGIILKIKDYDDIDSALKIIRKKIFIHRDSKTLAENEWYISDIIGSNVIDSDTGESYGRVTDILQYCPTDIYEILSPNGKTYTFPAITEVLKNVNVVSKIVTITPLPGLFE